MYRNLVLLTGNLGADAREHALDDGAVLFSFRVATTRRFRTKEGPQEDTQWHDVSYRANNDASAGYFRERLVKGALVDVEGRLHHDKYVDKDGVERKTTEVRASLVQAVPSGTADRKPDASSAARSERASQRPSGREASAAAPAAAEPAAPAKPAAPAPSAPQPGAVVW